MKRLIAGAALLVSVGFASAGELAGKERTMLEQEHGLPEVVEYTSKPTLNWKVLSRDEFLSWMASLLAMPLGTAPMAPKIMC